LERDVGYHIVQLPHAKRKRMIFGLNGNRQEQEANIALWFLKCQKKPCFRVACDLQTRVKAGF
jgi:hypothetical protein